MCIYTVVMLKWNGRNTKLHFVIFLLLLWLVSYINIMTFTNTNNVEISSSGSSNRNHRNHCRRRHNTEKEVVVVVVKPQCIGYDYCHHKVVLCQYRFVPLLLLILLIAVSVFMIDRTTNNVSVVESFPMLQQLYYSNPNQYHHQYHHHYLLHHHHPIKGVSSSLPTAAMFQRCTISSQSMQSMQSKLLRRTFIILYSIKPKSKTSSSSSSTSVSYNSNNQSNNSTSSVLQEPKPQQIPLSKVKSKKSTTSAAAAAATRTKSSVSDKQTHASLSSSSSPSAVLASSSSAIATKTVYDASTSTSNANATRIVDGDDINNKHEDNDDFTVARIMNNNSSNSNSLQNKYNSNTNNKQNQKQKSNNHNNDFRYKIQETQQQLLKSIQILSSLSTSCSDSGIIQQGSTTSDTMNNNNNNNNNAVILPKITQSYCDYLFAECIAHNEWDMAYNNVSNTIMEYANRCGTFNNNNNNSNTIQIQYSTYNACIQACFQNMNANSANQILQIMEQESSNTKDYHPQINDYTMVLLTMCRTHLASQSYKQQQQENVNWCHKAIELLKSIKNKNTTGIVNDVPITVYDAIFTCLKEDREWKQSIQLLQSMIDRSSALTTTKPVLSTYRIVIECCIASNQPDAAYRMLQSYMNDCIMYNRKIYQQQEQSEIESRINTNQQQSNTLVAMPLPTSYMFEMVICALTTIKGSRNSNSNRQLLWRRSIQLLDFMIDMDVPRTLLIYNSIFIACSKVREPSIAKMVHQKMKQYDILSAITPSTKYSNRQTTTTTAIRPNIVTYNSILSAYISNNNNNYWRDALQLFDQIQREPGVTPDICTYTNAIRACVKGGKIERAKSLIQVVKDKGLPLDSYFYTAALTASDWSDAILLLHEMEEKGIQPTEVSYSVTIKACGIGGQWEKALELLEIMRTTKNMTVNLFVYNAAIAAIAKAAKQRIKNYSNNGIVRSSKEISGNNELHQSLSKEVRSLLSKMRADGIEPDGFSYSSAMSCYGLEGQWEEALSTLQEMMNGGPSTQPNKVAYTAAISSCGRCGQVDVASQLFRQMQEEGHQPDTVAYNALFLAYREGNRSDLVLNLWNEMIEKSQYNPQKSTPRTRGDVPSSTRLRPDMITLTEAIEALTATTGTYNVTSQSQIDQIFSKAVEFGIVFRDESISLSFQSQINPKAAVPYQQFDFSYMSFPVARAACRYILFNCIPENVNDIKDIFFLTSNSGGQHGKIIMEMQQQRPILLSEYIQETLGNDFHLSSIVYNNNVTSGQSEQRQKTGVVLEAASLKEWQRHR